MTEYCNICGEDSDNLVYCSSCDTPFHYDCFGYNEKCPIDGNNGWHAIKYDMQKDAVRKKSFFDPLFITLLYRIRQL